MTRRIGTRAAAVRRAQEAKQLRDAKRIQREKQIEAALADFFEHTQRTADVTANAQTRVQRILAEADDARKEPLLLAAKAIAVLVGLLETRSAVCELTGLSMNEVREFMADAKGHTAGQQAAR